MTAITKTGVLTTPTRTNRSKSARNRLEIHRNPLELQHFWVQFAGYLQASATCGGTYRPRNFSSLAISPSAMSKYFLALAKSRACKAAFPLARYVCARSCEAAMSPRRL